MPRRTTLARTNDPHADPKTMTKQELDFAIRRSKSQQELDYWYGSLQQRFYPDRYTYGAYLNAAADIGNFLLAETVYRSAVYNSQADAAMHSAMVTAAAKVGRQDLMEEAYYLSLILGSCDAASHRNMNHYAIRVKRMDLAELSAIIRDEGLTADAIKRFEKAVLKFALANNRTGLFVVPEPTPVVAMRLASQANNGDNKNNQSRRHNNPYATATAVPQPTTADNAVVTGPQLVFNYANLMIFESNQKHLQFRDQMIFEQRVQEEAQRGTRTRQMLPSYQAHMHAAAAASASNTTLPPKQLPSNADVATPADLSDKDIDALSINSKASSIIPRGYQGRRI